MSKTTSYIVAVLACLSYLVLFVVVLLSTGRSFEQIGTIWKILFMGFPIIGIWSFMTSLAKKDDNKIEKTKNEQENHRGKPN